MLPVVGRAHVGYLPRERVVGISKLARVVRGFARRLQIQEKMTAEIAETIQEVLNPFGVGVVVEAEHSCMTLRGVDMRPAPCSPPAGSSACSATTRAPAQEFLEEADAGRLRDAARPAERHAREIPQSRPAPTRENSKAPSWVQAISPEPISLQGRPPAGPRSPGAACARGPARFPPKWVRFGDEEARQPRNL